MSAEFQHKHQITNSNCKLSETIKHLKMKKKKKKLAVSFLNQTCVCIGLKCENLYKAS
jgi:hypothetical protein